jgi:hypothetical protein
VSVIPADWIVPDWPAPDAVRAFITTRSGTVSERVERNRAWLNAYLPSQPRWLALQHGIEVVAAEAVGSEAPAADAATAITPGVVCCVTVADCLPVLLADRSGSVVAAAHAGWRGLAAGVIQATVIAMRRRTPRIGAIDAFLGPSIGPAAFEVGAEVLSAMSARLPDAEAAFTPRVGGKFLADLPALARQALAQVGVDSVFGGRWCTFSDPARFYSYRRDRVTGRHAAVIWLQPGGGGV